ncbi:hypothetical protein CHCC20491_0177 [Bacillus paralicheniformis]|uniref:hypothetical protein n=1 Tax=Bacillus subtilis group TaxID=653685 RepID=UPI0011A6C527|nr:MULTISPECIES: hypothetical protein [Bacillus subtilis group]MCY9236243.1 hypothetical protein [Bacillus licheniformis]TWN88805.1 hypothetical protein CHCC20491_0177 [Bacillus paralicheniformis]
MAKVYKAEFYITDISDEFYSVDDLKEKIEESPTFRWSLVHVSDVKESEEFEWGNDLKINNIAAATEDYEEYFKKK